MYYGYNDNKELILADEEFIELLGFSSFEKLRTSNSINNIKFKNKQLILKQTTQTISSDFVHNEVYGLREEFYLVELKNVQITHATSSTPMSKLNTNYKAIYLDVDKISEEIGLSVNDYKLYLDSFIDQSIIDEKRLLEGNDKVVKNLSNLALTLKIPHINILLLKIQKLSHRERMPLIDQYYTKLALLTLERPEDYEEEAKLVKADLFEVDKVVAEEEKEEILEDTLDAKFSDLLKNIDEKKESIDDLNLDLELEDDFSSELLDNNISPSLNKPEKTSKQISLEDVPQLPISYSPQTAADELNLPVVLIEEFVDDFIEQARHDKDHLLTSYYQHDMDNIHELGHKLKGAASNLRINELSDILEEIQFCEDYNKLESLFVRYWGHFLSLEGYMRQLKRV